MAKILLWVNTCQREDLLQRLIDDVERKMGNHQVDLFIFHDRSNDDYEDIKKHKLVKLFYTNEMHCGKEYYWRLINDGLSYIKEYRKDYDLFIKTDDDMLLCDKFFDLCLAYWNAIYHPRLFAIDILSAPRQRGKTLKGNPLSLIEVKPGISAYRTQWIDMNFIFNIDAFAKIGNEIKGCQAGARSSGVGLWLTRTFNFNYFEMYQTPVSLLIHGDHDSLMNYDERLKNKIITKDLCQ